MLVSVLDTPYAETHGYHVYQGVRGATLTGFGWKAYLVWGLRGIFQIGRLAWDAPLRQPIACPSLSWHNNITDSFLGDNKVCLLQVSTWKK